MEEIARAQDDLIYATRKSVLEAETIWRLTSDALLRQRTGPSPAPVSRRLVAIGWRVLFPWGGSFFADTWPDRVDYDDIVSIRLSYDPTRFDLTRRRCDLVATGGSRVILFSTRYVSVANFEDQAEAFGLFVDGLVRRVLAAKPATPVYSGITWKAYVLQHGLLLFMVVALASVLGSGIPALASVWAKIIIATTYVGASWNYMKRNWPRRLNPPTG